MADNQNRTPHLPIDFYRLKLSKSKLKAVTRTSALFSGFAMVAMVELGLDYSSLTDETQADDVSFHQTTVPFLLDESQNATRFIKKLVETTSRNVVPNSILIMYALVTSLLVGVHMLALMISTCILPQIEAISLEEPASAYDKYEHSMAVSQIDLNVPQTQALNDSETELDERYLSLNRRILDNNQRNLGRTNERPSEINDQQIMFPYVKYHRFIELAWISSTVVGIFLFLVEVGLICFIKFYPISIVAAFSGIVVMTPILVIFVAFTYQFYKQLAGFKVDLTRRVLGQVNNSTDVV